MQRRCVRDQYNEITIAYFRELVMDRDTVGRKVGGETISLRGENHLKYPKTHHTVLGSMSQELTDNTLDILGEDCITQYEKVRDTHCQRAALLREIAEGKPKRSPSKQKPC